jgi:hypothetical protein
MRKSPGLAAANYPKWLALKNKQRKKQKRDVGKRDEYID